MIRRRLTGTGPFSGGARSSPGGDRRAWDRIVRDQMATAAVIDRRVHHAVIPEFDVPCYRPDRSRSPPPPSVPPPPDAGDRLGPWCHNRRW